MATKKTATKATTKTKAVGVGVAQFMGKSILLKCMNYFYFGKIIGVDAFGATVQDCYVVFETGAFDAAQFKDAQKIGDRFVIALQSIEAFGPVSAVPKLAGS